MGDQITSVNPAGIDEIMALSDNADVREMTQQLEAMESEGQFPNLTRLEKSKPELLKAAAALLARGESLRTINRITGLSVNTIRAIAKHPTWGVSVQAQKSAIVGLARTVTSLTLESAIERAEAGQCTMLDAKLANDIATSLEGHSIVTAAPAAGQDIERLRALLVSAGAAFGQGVASGMSQAKTGPVVDVDEPEQLPET